MINLDIPKMKVVYNKKTGELVPCIWNKDGTVTVTTTGYIDEKYVIVSMVEACYVDLETGYIDILKLEKEQHGKEKTS